MVLYWVEWNIRDECRDTCYTIFGGMSEEDDKKQEGKVNVLGRWGSVGLGKGHCICK